MTCCLRREDGGATAAQTWSEVLSNGNTSGTTNAIMSASAAAAGSDSQRLTWQGVTSVATRSISLINEADAGADTYRLAALDNAGTRIFFIESNGNVTLDVANAGLSIGDATGTPAATLFKSAAGTGAVNWAQAGPLVDWQLADIGTEDLQLSRLIAGVFQNAPVIYRNATDVIDYGATTYNWDTASPILTYGDGTGSPTIQFNKAAAGVSIIGGSTGGLRDWEIELGDAAEDFVIQRYIAGVSQGPIFTIFNSSGGVQIGDGATGPTILQLDKLAAGLSLLRFSGGGGPALADWSINNIANETFELQRLIADVSQGIVLSVANATGNVSWDGGSGTHTWNTASPALTQGDGSGSPTFVRNKSAGGTVQVDFNAASVTEWRTEFGTTEDLTLELYAAGVFQFDAALWDHSTGDYSIAERVGLGNTTLGTFAKSDTKLEVFGQTIQILGSTSQADATDKEFTQAAHHRTAAEEPVALIQLIGRAASSVIRVGGGDAALNAATQFSVYTDNGGGVTTLTGTEQMRIASDGGVFFYNMKSGTTQAGAGAAANELWQDTNDADSVKMGV